MKMELVSTQNLGADTEREINTVAAAGFGNDKEATLDDTINHIRSADLIHLAVNYAGFIAGFAMYRSCLWR